MIGQSVLHYEILSKLGEGGMGVVYKARDTKLNRTVALKFLPSHIGADGTEKKRFINEAQSASTLDHSNICTIHSIEETDDGNLFIVMAYYEGMSLKEKIEQGPLPLKDVVNYAIQISSGLQKAHEKGIVHRDLKPANIFITNDDQIKIIDFGLARFAERSLLTKSGKTLGTVPYMSPEQAQGSKVDHRTDIWSLGIVIYEMITGQRPFKSEYETALVYSIINEDPEPVTGLRSGVPMNVERIIQKCLEKDPLYRHQHVDEIIVDFKKAEREMLSGVRSNISIPGVDNVARSVPKDRVNMISRQRSKFLLYVIPVFILVLFGVYYFLSQRVVSPGIERSIAVLPFENLSPDPNDEYFADGVHEDIIIQLSGLSNLRVIARSSVVRYQNDNRDRRQIARDLNVTTILEGSVRRVGNVIRVAVQLVDPHRDQTLWGESYERNFTDMFEIQRAIAMEIATTLKANISSRERKRLDERPTEVPEAYSAYLKGRYHGNNRTEEGLQRALDYFQQAIDLDPAFAAAYAGLGDTYMILGSNQLIPQNEAFPKAKTYIERALALDPESSEAYSALASTLFWSDQDWIGGEKALRRAIELNPGNANAIYKDAFFSMFMGWHDRGFRQYLRSIELDPLTPRVQANLGLAYVLAGKYHEAIAHLNIVIRDDPKNYAAYLYLANAYHLSGKTDEALLALERVREVGDIAWHKSVMAQMYAFAGKIDDAKVLLS